MALISGFRKHVNIESLLQRVKSRFEKIESPVQTREFKLTDYLISALAMFRLKYSSLLKFDQDSCQNNTIRANMERLFGVLKMPGDTAMREVLDLLDPAQLRPIFKDLLAFVQRGKILEDYRYLNGAYLININGTGVFRSESVHCDNCCQIKHRNGKVSYFHQLLAAVIVHPAQKQVIPLAPEPIQQQDGTNKNDCELNAIKRLIADLRREHPHMKIIVLLDGLYADGPVIELLRDFNMEYIIVAKRKKLTKLFEKLNAGSQVKQHEIIDKQNIRHQFRYLEDVSLNDSWDDLKVNLIEYREVDETGKVRYYNCWITALSVTPDTLERLMRAGRARWKVENETFNTLKNQGYHLEHNYGHGHKHLTTVLAMIMFLAFLIDQIELRCCKVFQAALAKAKKLSYLRIRIRSLFTEFIVPNWQSLYHHIALGNDATPIYLPDTS